ncbi:MAG: hypothetical protein JXA21_27455 [Anaerolineae bacterium]|nr:hypothetical protein [Anaerolineae bacterium]
MENREPFRNRLGRFVTVVVIVAVIALVVVITQRLSNDSLALLIGLGCGIIAMVPALGLSWLMLRRETARQQQVAHTPPSTTPPVIVVTPQMPALPGYSVSPPAVTTQATVPWPATTSGRTFTIVGGEES